MKRALRLLRRSGASIKNFQNNQSFVEKESKTPKRQQVEYIVNMTMEQQ